MKWFYPLVIVVSLLLVAPQLARADVDQYPDDTLVFPVLVLDTLGYPVGAIDSVGFFVTNQLGKVGTAMDMKAVTWTGDSSYQWTNFRMRKRGTGYLPQSPTASYDTTYLAFVLRSSIVTQYGWGTYVVTVLAHSSASRAGSAGDPRRWTTTQIPFVYGGVTLADSSIVVGKIKSTAFQSRAFATDCITSVAIAPSAAMEFRDTTLGGVRGLVGATPNDSTVLSTSAALGTTANFYNGCPISVYYGTGKNQSAVITSSAYSGGYTFHTYPKFTTAPAANDSFVIYTGLRGLYGQMAKATLDSSAAEAAKYTIAWFNGTNLNGQGDTTSNPTYNSAQLKRLFYSRPAYPILTNSSGYVTYSNTAPPTVSDFWTSTLPSSSDTATNPTYAGSYLKRLWAAIPAYKLGVNSSGYVTYANSAPPTGASIAALVLATPAQKLVTDANGYVTYSNAAPPAASDIWTYGTRTLSANTNLGFPSNFNLLSINGSGYVVYSNTAPPTAADVWGYSTRALTEKTNFSLSQTFPTNFSTLSINGSGYVTYANSAPPTAQSIVDTWFDDTHLESADTTTHPTYNSAWIKKSILSRPLYRLTTNSSGYVTYANTAPPTAAAIRTVFNSMADSLYDSLHTIRSDIAGISSGGGLSPGDATKIADSVKDALFADITKKLGFVGGAGDTVKAKGTFTGLLTIDTSDLRKAVWQYPALVERMVSYIDPLFLACSNGDTVSVGDNTLRAFMNEVRRRTRLYSGSLLNDGLLRDAASKGIQYTSTDAGGLENGFRITTVNGRAFYRVPDSTVQIVYASLVSGGYTKSIKSYPPEYVEGDLSLDHLEGIGPDQVPRAYKWWNDTLQLIPIPVKTDSIYFSTFIRHPLIILDTATVKLKGDFREAAILYTIYKVWMSVDEYGKADAYLKAYRDVADRARAAAVRKVDAGLKGENKQ